MKASAKKKQKTNEKTEISLWDNTDVSYWHQCLEEYTLALTMVASNMKSIRNYERLIELDKWYYEELPRKLKEGREEVVTLEEMEWVTEWKLLRGKWRPKLKQVCLQL